MEKLKSELNSFTKRIAEIKNKIKSEEATKQSMVLPLLQILGYDIFNPEEVIPEVTCDISGKGDKIDYVIANKGRHEILIECKECHQNLYNHISQLKKYFVASDARFAILTNGIDYLFFSDHDKANIMDEKPFYSLNMLSLSEEDINFLSGFSKESFNSNYMKSISQEIVTKQSILKKLRHEFSQPSKEFVRLLTSEVYDGKLYDSIYHQFSEIIKKSIKLLLSEDLFKDVEIIEKDILVCENKDIYTEEEQKIIRIVKEYLTPSGSINYNIRTRKLSNGYISFDFNNRWWPICRIKIRPKFDNKICVRICKEASASKCSEIYIKDIECLQEARNAIMVQFSDTKDRFFQYKSEH